MTHDAAKPTESTIEVRTTLGVKEIRMGSVLTSRKNGQQYTVTQVRVRETGGLLSVYAVDFTSNVMGIVIYPAEFHRWIVSNV